MIKQRQHPLSGKAAPPHWKSDEASEKGPPDPPKSEILAPQKKAFPRFHLDMDFLQKTASKLVNFVLCSSISDLHTPIGGHHPMLYFPSQIQRNIVLCYANPPPPLTVEDCRWGFPSLHLVGKYTFGKLEHTLNMQFGKI